MTEILIDYLHTTVLIFQQDIPQNQIKLMVGKVIGHLESIICIIEEMLRQSLLEEIRIMAKMKLTAYQYLGSSLLYPTILSFSSV